MWELRFPSGPKGLTGPMLILIWILRPNLHRTCSITSNYQDLIVFIESNITRRIHRRGLETCDALLTLPHRLQVGLDRGTEGRLLQLDFSAAFDRVNQCCLLYKLRSIGVGDSSCPYYRRSLVIEDSECV